MACGDLASGLDDFEGIEGSTRLSFRWCPLESLATLPLRPAFLAPALRTPPATPVHVVHED